MFQLKEKKFTKNHIYKHLSQLSLLINFNRVIGHVLAIGMKLPNEIFYCFAYGFNFFH